MTGTGFAETPGMKQVPFPRRFVRTLVPERPRRGAAALEFSIVAPLLLLIFIGLMEFSRAMTVLGILANAARSGARAGAITPGTYSDVRTAAQAALTPAGLAGAATIVVQVNSVTVTDDATFTAQVTAGSAVAVRVSVPYNNISWLPASRFLTGRTLAESAVMQKEG
jgi:Flp pilus assembly protein TadG